MKCDICGNEFDDSMKVCPFCGATAQKNAQQTDYSPSYVPDAGSVVINSVQYENERKQKSADNYAIVSFVLSLLGLNSCGIGSILGLIFGCLGVKSKDRKSLAVAGIIISIISLLFTIAIVILYVFLISVAIKEGKFEDVYPYSGL